ncbi:hypothetical protein LTS08_005259 [Lithohypha guttulata]|nr:hypothetical protein LTS08_005259 [Lithohypha guttulata]
MSSSSFSYAQAARGLTPTSNLSSNPTSSASSEHGAKDPIAAADPTAIQSKQGRNITKMERESFSTQRSSQNITNGNGDTGVEKTSQPAEVEARMDKTHQTSGPDDITLSSKSSEPVAPTQASEADELEHKDQQSSEGADSHERAKEVDDDWEQVSMPSVAAEKAEKELKPAPVPTVNFWQQRSLALQAKAKDQTIHKQPVPVTSQPSKPRSQAQSVEESKKKSATREAATTDTVNGIDATRGNSTTRKSRDQTSSNSSPKPAPQRDEKPAVRHMPPVDTASWPTPESSNVDMGRRSSAVDKVEKNDVADTKTATRKNQWTALPFVPSVKFETQIPSGRRGGRPATRGRGGSTTQGERLADKSELSSMGPPPLPKTISDQDRGRRSSGIRPNHAGAASTEHRSPEAFDPQQSATPVNSATDSMTASGILSTERTVGTDTPSTHDPSRSSSRNAPEKAQRQNVDSNRYQSVDSRGSPNRPPRQSDDMKSVGEISDQISIVTGERTQAKEWQKDRGSNAQKSDNWRAEKRGERAERGRGVYRGRGNHANFNNPAFSTPLPQNGFEKQGPPSARSSQGAPYGSPYSSTRGNGRTQSIPLYMLGNGFYQPTPGFPQNLPPIQTDMAINYGQMTTGMPSTTMSAMPYGDPLGGYALISMVITQLEYYFSLDNLCKDMFLRKNMDSQGYVPLRVLGEFRRIKSLLGESTSSHEHLRHMAQQCRNTEYVIGEDGEDRLRSRENWRDFVLPMSERLPQAQDDGPKIKSNHPRYSTGMVPDFQMSNGLRSAPPNVNGFHDALPSSTNATPFQPGSITEPQSTEQWASRVESARHDVERRESTTSPLSKVQSPSQDSRSVFANLTNGHRDSVSSSSTAKENTFPDEEVLKLKVVVKDPDFQGEDNIASDEPLPIRGSGLRGGAGSPENFDRLRNVQFGQSGPGSKGNQHTIYFTQGEAPSHYVRAGYIHEDYVSLREQALNQRAEGHFGGACAPLYPLWAEFLTVPNQFNVGMYEDFKTWAIEDQEKGNDNGKRYLVRFYDAMLSSRNAMTERLATDIVEIARQESGGNRPTWLKLRAAWRNGATNMKTRKRLTDLLSAEEQAELERGAA